ncbi:larval cuticle protein 1-like [Penaeus indicus]|uniref:larval cuticle protein 1-like n=1 Tax=Penaeus indicus TaxID=29960 RepID=UPI00300C236B
MKAVILACMAAVAVAAPQYAYETPAPTYLVPAASSRDESAEVIEFIPILRDDRVHEDDGRYNLDVETANGISMSQSGSPDGPDGAIVKAGQYSYTAPDGSLIEIKFVANENGFQPQGAHLPVAPEFPHPIPQFVLDQIAFAAEEDAARERAEAQASAPAPTRLKFNCHVYISYFYLIAIRVNGHASCDQSNYDSCASILPTECKEWPKLPRIKRRTARLQEENAITAPHTSVAN